VEAREFLKVTGQSPADLSFEARAELAQAKIRDAVAARAGKQIGATQVAEYYGQHRSDFETREVREVELASRLSEGEAARLRQRMSRRDTAAPGVRRWHVERPPDVLHRRSKEKAYQRALEIAIFTAKPNVLIGPFRDNRDFYVIEVKRITPAVALTLAQASPAIESRLRAAQTQRALLAFTSAATQASSAKTVCAPGFEAPKCGG
jgi:hypothetical protein